MLDGLSNDLAANWKAPSGRLRSDDTSRRSQWLGHISDADREWLEAFGSESAGAALFGMLAVLDGVRKIEDQSEGHLELRHIHDGAAQLLASSAPDRPVPPLHEPLPQWQECVESCH